MKINPKEYFKHFNDKLNGIYRGVIEDNVDPDKMGRCKIRIFGIHTPKKTKTLTEGIPTDELPWADPVMGLFEGSVSGFGAWTVPLQGSHVYIFFESGNILEPKYFATVPGKPTDQNHGFTSKEGFSDPDEEYPVTTISKPHKPNALNESDFHRLARNEDTGDTIVDTKTINKNASEPAPYYNAEYPHNKVFATHSGITIEIDDTPDNKRIHVYHPSNSYIEINNDGNVIIRNANDKYVIIDGKKLEYTESNNTIYVKGKLTISADSGIDIWSGGDINIDGTQIHLNDGIASKKTTI